ncbi:MAG: hypothetical protein KIT09_14545 [Bryobacteraceae bacterium]|nr:hypothetical protein [Bryobacteraceae bacterium]
MTRAEQQLAESINFQLSLLKLAEVADANRGAAPTSNHSHELKQLMEKVPVRKRSSKER